MEEVTETLKNAPERPLDLGFIPGNYINNTSAIKENYSCKFPSGPYGMELGDINVNGAVEIEVVKVDPKGAAARTNLIKPHDRIVRVGNVHVSGMPFAKLVSAFCQTENICYFDGVLSSPFPPFLSAPLYSEVFWRVQISVLLLYYPHSLPTP